ncbi:putative pentatricopeptide repeat-containing protein At3g15930 [Nymphaea colorata]|uniref:DYW domain-containing protein n=1 Tax=Nymphaea colorata TaxID=210225 RepID=A0A5K1DZH4_9MAGN|nr:putative pentatricopeptide repeat-containing protein At3g15930 [Nymphaea colorata]
MIFSTRLRPQLCFPVSPFSGMRPPMASTLETLPPLPTTIGTIVHHPKNQNHNPSILLLEKCNSIKELRQIHAQFIRNKEHYQPNTFAWNTIIRCYSRWNDPRAAAGVYVDMLNNGLRPDNYTFPFVLKAFNRELALDCGKEFHGQIIKYGKDSLSFVQNALIHMYSGCGSVDDARLLFDKSPERDAIAWNAMIAGYIKSKKYEEALSLFSLMRAENVKPTPVTFVSVVSACTKLRDFAWGRRIHLCIEESGIELNLILENALLDMYATCGRMDEAANIFEKMPVKDIISWTTMVTGFTDMGKVDKARELFDQMPDRDFVSWTAMIDGYIRANRFKEALAVFREMQMAKVQPDEFTMVSILTACAHLGALDVGEWIRVYIEKSNIKTDVFVGNAFIDMYSKCGSIESAIDIFDRMPQRDKFTWTAMITGLAINGYAEEALNLFSKMVSSTMPDEITYIGVLSACTHAGLVDKGKEYFSSMVKDYGILPTVSHYGCMVDLLGRAGKLDEALELIDNMPMKPNSIVWGAFLGACRVHKNIELAEKAAKHLLELEPENGAAYVLLSNIYAVCNRWDDVRKVRSLMTDKKMKKTPGCSLIEMNGVVHEFVAGDGSHPQSKAIYSKLDEMASELKLAGYVPNTSEVLLDLGEEEKEDALHRHSEKLALAFGLINSGPEATIRIVKNLRMCPDCHSAIKIISKLYGRKVVIRDRTRFHHFDDGFCSCKDFW